MIEELTLRNFRGFDSHTVPLRPLIIIVGKNNAGKSTVVEALRLVSMVTSRYQFLHYRELPSWIDRPRCDRGVYPSTEGLDQSPVGIFHRYGDPPATIIAKFSSGDQVEVLVGPALQVVGIIRDKQGQVIRTKGQANHLQLPQVSILPQIGPLLRDESLLVSAYVRQSMSSSRSSLHFRNQLHLLQEYFAAFQKTAQETWPGLAIQQLSINEISAAEASLCLLVRDSDFTAEVGWMGHGLQMWLQTMWFLTYSAKSNSVILDEPDVYMHADLQRRLIRLLRTQKHQTIVATHSVEIMSEVEPEEILVIDRKRARSYFAGKQPAVQSLLNSIGSIQNIQLARLGITKRFLMLEGDDIDFLKRFQDTLFPLSQVPIDTIPHKAIGGWSGWERARGCAMLLLEAASDAIQPYCILDSDYHTPKAIEKRKTVAKSEGIQLHVWKRKEIENYLLVPSAISRLIQKGAKKNSNTPSEKEIRHKLAEIAEKLKLTAFNGMATEFLEEDRASGLPGANQKADLRLNSIWKKLPDKLTIVSGKEVIHKLSDWSNKEFGVSFNAIKLAKELLVEEIDSEICDVMTAIEEREDLPS